MKQRKATARKKIGYIITEIDSVLLRCGGREISLRLRREDAGLRLHIRGDFDPEKRASIQRTAELLQPAVRDPALVTTYWELTGDNLYTGDSELTLVGHMLDSAKVEVGPREVSMELYLAY